MLSQAPKSRRGAAEPEADIEATVAVYCTADNRYIVPSLIALDSVRRFHPGCAYFVIGNADDIATENLELLQRHGIGFIHSEQNLHFKSSVWPNSAYLTLFGPEILLGCGFSYSLGLDPDILCVSALDMSAIFSQTRGFAGIENHDPRSSNFADPVKVQSLWNLSDQVLAGRNTNTGVVFWNNRAAAEFHLGERCICCYQELVQNGAPVVGDQALFALVSVTAEGLPFRVLDYLYNYRVGNSKDLQRSPRGVKIFHFTGRKPWQSWQPATLREYLFKPRWFKFHAMWRDHVKKRGLPMPTAEGIPC